MRLLRGTLLLCAVLTASFLATSSQSQAAAKSRCAARSAGSLAAIKCARIRPVASLQPAATQRQWRRLVSSRKTKLFATAPDCRSLRAVFYAPSDWLRLATKLAANASSCARYYISIPPLAADKTAFRTDQAWRIRALGPNFHPLAEINTGGWRSWVSANNSTWYEAGVEARRRMAAAGFDVTLGDSWIVNEFPSTATSGVGPARANMRQLVHGLYDGYGGSPTKGGVFDIGLGQGTRDLSTYKSQLEAWLQDAPFWSDMSRYVSDWSQELYGDPRDVDVAGVPLATRRDYLTDYLRHQLVHVRLGGDATAAARVFLESADSPLANAAWQWDFGFGWTMVSADQMKGYVSAQVYALRHFSAEDGEPGDHWGFAWAPHNGTNMSAADFASQTGEILDRLAAAIHDSGPVDAADPGILACGAPGDLWCADELPGAWLNDAWKTFTYWGRLGLAFGPPPLTLNAGNPSGALAVQTTLAGAAHTTPAALAVGLSSSSSAGRFATSPGGPWAGTVTVTIPAGADTSPAFYYEDTQAGNPVLTASATGTDSGSQTEAVVAGPVATLTVSPASASLAPGASQQFVAGGADGYGNPVSVDSANWSVAPAAFGAVSPGTGGSAIFTAGQAGGQGSVTVSLGGVTASASVTVALPAAVPPPPPPPPPPVAPLSPPVECVVPALRGKTVLGARRALARHHCALGTKRWVHSPTIRRGRVLSQKPRPGVHRPRGARVNVILSSGPRRRR